MVDLEGRDIKDYITFVAAEVGWQDEGVFERGTCGVAGARRLASLSPYWHTTPAHTYNVIKQPLKHTRDILIPHATQSRAYTGMPPEITQGDVLLTNIDRISQSNNGVMDTAFLEDYRMIIAPLIGRNAVGTQVKVQVKRTQGDVIKSRALSGEEIEERDYTDVRDTSVDFDLTNNSLIDLREDHDSETGTAETTETGESQPDPSESEDSEGDDHHDPGPTLKQDGSETVEAHRTVETTPETTKDSDEIIRDDAIDAGTATQQNPPERTTRYSQYNRNDIVKTYVKQRADGKCEGCGEPAPFTSKTGNPYLHAHHVNELSGGGKDSIENVIALCPNCHYRVHDGEDGEQYNVYLKRRLRHIEGDANDPMPDTNLT